LSVPERTAVIVAKGKIRSILRTYLEDELSSIVTTLGVEGIGLPAPDQFYDTKNRTTLFQYMGQRNETVSCTVFQSRPNASVNEYTGDSVTYTELTETEFTIVVAHGMIGFEPITFYGKSLEETEEAMSLRSDLYTGAIMETLRERLVDGSGDVVTVDKISSYSEIDTPPEMEGVFALATLRIRIQQEVLISQC